MFAFRAKLLPSRELQLNFDQLSRCLPGKRYSAGFNLLAGTGSATTIIVDPLPPGSMVLGSINYTGAVAFQDACSWAWRQTGASIIETSVHNNSANTAVGTLYVCILGFE